MVQDFARWSRREVRVFGEDGFEAENTGAPKDDVRGGGGLVLGKDLDQGSGLEGALSAEIVCERGIGGGIEVGRAPQKTHRRPQVVFCTEHLSYEPTEILRSPNFEELAGDLTKVSDESSNTTSLFQKDHPITPKTNIFRVI